MNYLQPKNFYQKIKIQTAQDERGINGWGIMDKRVGIFDVVNTIRQNTDCKPNHGKATRYSQQITYANNGQKQERGSGDQEKKEQKPVYDPTKKEEIAKEGERLQDAADDIINTLDSVLDDIDQDLKKYEDIANQHTELGGQ